jgi:hypothetical protein
MTRGAAKDFSSPFKRWDAAVREITGELHDRLNVLSFTADSAASFRS